MFDLRVEVEESEGNRRVSQSLKSARPGVDRATSVCKDIKSYPVSSSVLLAGKGINRFISLIHCFV